LFPEDGSIEITAPISSIETTDDKSELYGLEITASHALSYIPGFAGGFGGKLSYNYADSDFEFEDDFAGAGVGLDENGDQVQLVGLVPPADIFGLSRHVLSAQVYWGNEVFDAKAIYKYRSDYFQQFVDTPGRIRYTDDNAVVEFKASYKATENIKITFEALNLTDEPRVDYRGLEGNVANVYSYGRRFFVGLQGKF
jgi:outer membrane receptor protein involved in Fe transport